MSILDHTSHDLSPREHGYETNDFGEIVGFEHAELEKTAPEHYFDPFVEQADTGDFPSLRADASPVSTSGTCLLYTSPSPRDQRGSRMPSSA